MMRIQALGHVVLKVRDLTRAVAFYEGVLGMPVVARETIRGYPMVFFSFSGNHHDLALLEVGGQAPVPPFETPGLAHVALKIGDDIDTLRAAREHLESRGVEIDRTVDHRVSQSLYLHDPDGHAIELYIDADPRIWHEDPKSVAYSEPFVL